MSLTAACAVAPLALVVVLAAACSDNATRARAPNDDCDATTLSAPARRPAPTGPDGAVDRRARSCSGSATSFRCSDGQPRAFAPEQVEGKSLRRSSARRSGSFWAGAEREQRILVKMRLKGGSPPKLDIGQQGDFVGLLVQAPEDAESAGREAERGTACSRSRASTSTSSAADVKLQLARGPQGAALVAGGLLVAGAIGIARRCCSRGGGDGGTLRSAGRRLGRRRGSSRQRARRASPARRPSRCARVPEGRILAPRRRRERSSGRRRHSRSPSERAMDRRPEPRARKPAARMGARDAAAALAAAPSGSRSTSRRELIVRKRRVV